MSVAVVQQKPHVLARRSSSELSADNSSSQDSDPLCASQTSQPNGSPQHGSSSVEGSDQERDGDSPGFTTNCLALASALSAMAAKAVSLADDPPAGKGEVVAVKCGALSGKLHLERFRCPGIHQMCVELEGHWVSPKQMTVMAAKDKQKDWKGAIKLHGQQIRTLMERKELDFYDHEEFCSGRCVSKNNRLLSTYNGEHGRLDSSTDAFTQATTAEPELLHPLTLPSNPYTQFLRGYQQDLQQMLKADLEVEQDAMTPVIAPDFFAFLRTGVLPPGLGLAAGLQHLNPMLASAANGHNALVSARDLDTISVGSPDSLLIFKDPPLFWSVVNQLGLFGDLMREISLDISRFLNPTLPKNKIPEVADKLSRLVEIMGLQDRVYQCLQAKRSMAKAQTQVLSTELEDLKRKTQEQERRRHDMKRRSDLLDHLVGGPASKQACLALQNVLPSPEQEEVV